MLNIFFTIFFGASICATLALYTRQSIIVAYIIFGILVGPHGLSFVSNISLIHEVSEIGIIFLLFLLGLNLDINRLLKMLGKAVFVCLASSLSFIAIVAFTMSYFTTYSQAFMIASVLIFSSTIVSLKLLPTTTLHHKHIGELVIGILLIQDFIAIIMLTLFTLFSSQVQTFDLWLLLKLLIALPCLIALSLYAYKFLLFKLFTKYSRFKEYIFLLGIAWCLLMVNVSLMLGLSGEIGAFIAGVTLASSPIAKFIYENLKPLRDFFLILFFFTIGASFNITLVADVWREVIILTIILLIAKPFLHYITLRLAGETNKKEDMETAVRLGQGSEFSLLLIGIAGSAGFASIQSVTIVGAVTILSFIISSYYVVLKYPSPIALSNRLRKD
ncbi:MULTISPECIES: cation:proton antiporter domain-containing protein [Cysteiniphilum]|uniref:cation:proton antiporter domain-containing protein n=1 Tax=Cysteiniphilum TaxID=2056696 RepID=UPI001CE344A1|nr:MULTISPECIES: cation:proton antiporter [Cysteiniphilum]